LNFPIWFLARDPRVREVLFLRHRFASLFPFQNARGPYQKSPGGTAQL
jgi:hypothetical protein